MPFIYGNMGIGGEGGSSAPGEPITTTDTVLFTLEEDAELTAESETVSLLKTDRT